MGSWRCSMFRHGNPPLCAAEGCNAALLGSVTLCIPFLTLGLHVLFATPLIEGPWLRT